tara:strand:+ start:202 stop:360 length:159 start_codon:yes stop_codon:yes gene_type:complete
MAKYKVEFESVPVVYVESDTEEDIYDEVVNAWVMYSGYDLPDYQITEVYEEE